MNGPAQGASPGGSPTVAVVEDDHTVRTVVGEYLRAGGYGVDLYENGVQATQAFAARLPDLIILDRMLPGLSGDEVCRDVRARSDVPIVMLTALSQVEERIDGLEEGADDYLGKPFSLRELQLRVEALLRRRSASGAADVIRSGPFRLDPVHRRAWKEDRELSLTAREYELLTYLVRHPGTAHTRDELFRNVWGWSVGDPSTVTVHVRRLREKIECDPRTPAFLTTTWGEGYTFDVSGGAGC